MKHYILSHPTFAVCISTAWLNDICINDGTILLQLHFNTPSPKHCNHLNSCITNPRGRCNVAISTAQCLLGEALMALSHSLYHTIRALGLGVMDFTRREIGFFDSIADESLWKQDVQV